MTRSFFKNATILFSFTLIAVCFFCLTSCSDDEQVAIDPIEPPIEEKVTASSDQVVNVPFFVVNEAGELPANPDDLLYDVRMNNPVLAPEGHQVTWGEFSAVRGALTAECRDEGTYVNFRVTGLIPNGVYTVWNVDVKDPGFDPAGEMFNIIGIGAAGRGDGSDNTFVATAEGVAEITLVSPGGDLSMFGSIGNCALTDQFEWHIVGAYHIDGMTYGPDLGPDGTVVEQFGFAFRSDSL